MCLHPSASIPDGPDPPLVFIHALRTSSPSMVSNLTKWTDSGSSGSRTSSQALGGFGCFCFRSFKVSLFSRCHYLMAKFRSPCCLLTTLSLNLHYLHAFDLQTASISCSSFFHPLMTANLCV